MLAQNVVWPINGGTHPVIYTPRALSRGAPTPLAFFLALVRMFRELSNIKRAGFFRRLLLSMSSSLAAHTLHKFSCN